VIDTNFEVSWETQSLLLTVQEKRVNLTKSIVLMPNADPAHTCAIRNLKRIDMTYCPYRINKGKEIGYGRNEEDPD